MLLYNVTVCLDPNIENEWVKWMLEKHIPDVLATACFLKCTCSKIRGKEAAECSYSLLYLAKSSDSYHEYQENHAGKLQAEHNLVFEGRYTAFRTILDVIKEMDA